MTAEVRLVDHAGLCASWSPGEDYVWAVYDGDELLPLGHYYDKTLADLALGFRREDA